MMKKTAAAILILVIAIGIGVTATEWQKEREEIISDAIESAKQTAKQNEEEEAKYLENRMRPWSSSEILARGFKRPSEEALREGKARLLMEDMVYRAERKLMELKKQKDGSQNDPKVLLEDLGKELFHRPGSLLTKSELDLIYQESKCRKVKRRPPYCNRASINTYRTIDGTCNNLKRPLQGSAGIPFRRLVPPFYEDGVSSLRGSRQFANLQPVRKGLLFIKSGPFDPPFPSPRLISQRIVRNNSQEETPLTHIVMQWGQFLDHDLDLGPEIEKECEGCKETRVCQPIRVPPNDPAFGTQRGKERKKEEDNCIPFRRSLLACTKNTRGSFSPSEQINDLTSYLDGSQVYGSSLKVASSLRTFRKGLLKTSRGNNLPETTHDCLMRLPRCFLAGDIRSNEQVGLTAMHTLWMREHNRIAKQLGSYNSDWSDEKLYQEARKIVGAMMQKITYEDYLPLIFGKTFLRTLLPPYKRYRRNVDASIPNSFATGAYRYGHSLVRPVFARFLSDLYERGTNRPLNLRNSFFNQKAFLQTNLGAIFRGLVTQNSLQMDESVNSVLTTQLFQRPGARGLDLAALNIQRQRDHGMAPYTVWRNFCQREFKRLPLATIESGATMVRLLKTYGFLDNVDFWLGGITEKAIKNGVLGPTFACIQSLTFQNLRDGDRFWYQKRGVFTPQQLQEINKASLSRVICDNTVVNVIQKNAFVSNQKRVSCKSLPQIDLKKWSESSCYLRVTSNSAGRGIRILLSYIRQGVIHSTSGRHRLKGAIPTCIPLECPLDSVKENVLVFPRYRYGRRRCNRITVNPKLPYKRTYYLPYLYWGKRLSQSLIDAQSGIYSSLKKCKSGQATAVTYKCYGYEAESSSLTEIESDTDTSDCTSPSAKNCTLPIDKPTFENKELEFALVTSEEQDNNNDIDDFAAAADSEDTKKEDENLMEQLEETLQKVE